MAEKRRSPCALSVKAHAFSVEALIGAEKRRRTTGEDAASSGYEDGTDASDVTGSPGPRAGRVCPSERGSEADCASDASREYRTGINNKQNRSQTCAGLGEHLRTSAFDSIPLRLYWTFCPSTAAQFQLSISLSCAVIARKKGPNRRQKPDVDRRYDGGPGLVNMSGVSVTNGRSFMSCVAVINTPISSYKGREAARLHETHSGHGLLLSYSLIFVFKKKHNVHSVDFFFLHFSFL